MAQTQSRLEEEAQREASQAAQAAAERAAAQTQAAEEEARREAESRIAKQAAAQAQAAEEEAAESKIAKKTVGQTTDTQSSSPKYINYLQMRFVGGSFKSPQTQLFTYIPEETTVNELHAMAIASLKSTQLRGRLTLYIKHRNSFELVPELYAILGNDARGYEEIEMDQFNLQLNYPLWDISSGQIFVKIQDDNEIRLVVRPVSNYPFDIYIQRDATLQELQKMIQERMNRDRVFYSSYKIFIGSYHINKKSNDADATYEYEQQLLTDFGIVDGTELYLEAEDDDDDEDYDRYDRYEPDPSPLPPQKYEYLASPQQQHSQKSIWEFGITNGNYPKHTDEPRYLHRNNQSSLPDLEDEIYDTLGPHHPYVHYNPKYNKRRYPKYKNLKDDTLLQEAQSRRRNTYLTGVV